jgi:hypothetical protein
MEEPQAQAPASDEQSQAIQEPTQEETQEVVTQDEQDETIAEPVEQTEQTAPEYPESEAPTQEQYVEEEPDWQPQPLDVPQAQLPDIRNYVDAEGNLDLNVYNAALSNAINGVVTTAVTASTSAVTMQSRYEKEWNKAENKYPELSKNKQLKDMVQAIHANSAQPGFKYLSPEKAADQLFAIRGEAKSEGMKAAQVTRTVQSAAALGSPNPAAPVAEGNKIAQLKEQMKYGATKTDRSNATTSLLKELISKGQI